MTMSASDQPTPPPMPTALSGLAPIMDSVPVEDRRVVLMRSTLIAMIAFLTLIDLFGSQALLPLLVEEFGVSRAAMGFAVNASTIGMAAASLTVAVFARRIDRKRGIWICLALLSVPTFCLGLTEDLTTFTLLRILQGVLMATAFTLTLTYLSEECSATAVAGAMAAYITGNVASNLFGRLMASELAGTFGLSESFTAFAVLNLSGALLAYLYIGSTSGRRPPPSKDAGSIFAAWGTHFADPRLRAAFGIGFLLLFTFVATFTYANFVLAQPPFSLSQGQIGIVYAIFLPAMATTPAAAYAVTRAGPRAAFLGAMAASLLGLTLLLATSLTLFLTGLALVGAGLFFAQSVATSFVGRTALADHAAANGLYLASYYAGGIVGALVVGRIFERAGWPAAVASLLVAAALAAWAGMAMRPGDRERPGAPDMAGQK